MTVLDRLEALLRDASPLPWRAIPTMHDRETAIAAVNALPALLRVARAAEELLDLLDHTRVKCETDKPGEGNAWLEEDCAELQAALADLAKEAE